MSRSRIALGTLIAGFCFLAGSPIRAALDGDGMHPPPGNFVAVEGYRLYVHCVGTRGPVVIIAAGLGGSAAEWQPVQSQLQQEYRVCAYDRGGYGWSDPGPMPRDAETITRELTGMLEATQLPAPYVLVGHSFGGLVAQLYAATHPRAVRGLVLVESSHVDQGKRLGKPLASVAGGRRFNPIVMPAPDHYRILPESARAETMFLNSRRKAIFAQMSELREFETSAAQVRAAGALPDVPLVALTRGVREWPKGADGDRREAVWRALQNEIAQLTRRSRHAVVGNAGHNVHLDDPTAVANAVRAVATLGAEKEGS